MSDYPRNPFETLEQCRRADVLEKLARDAVRDWMRERELPWEDPNKAEADAEFERRYAEAAKSFEEKA